VAIAIPANANADTAIRDINFIAILPQDMALQPLTGTQFDGIMPSCGFIA
jgi:hypothetical protein